MPLTMRPSGLASTGYYKDHADYLIFCGGWNIGRIYEIRSGPEELRSVGNPFMSDRVRRGKSRPRLLPGRQRPHKNMQTPAD